MAKKILRDIHGEPLPIQPKADDLAVMIISLLLVLIMFFLMGVGLIVLTKHFVC